MNYQKIYDSLIDKSIKFYDYPKSYKSKRKGFAIHHIIPASWFKFGRKDKEANVRENLVYLSHKEHFLAHWLLAKLYGGSMSHTFHLMCHETGITSGKIYENHLMKGLKSLHSDKDIQERRIEALRKVCKTEDWLNKNRIMISNRKTDQYSKNMSIAQKELFSNPARRETHKLAMLKRYENPEYHKKVSDRNKKAIKPIIATEIETGKEIIIRGQSEIISLGFSPGNVSSCCNGKRKNHKGFTFKFLNGDI